jgi:hypothetical protein
LPEWAKKNEFENYNAENQGQLLGAGRPINRDVIQLFCSPNDSLMTPPAFNPGYLAKTTSFLAQAGYNS